MGLFDWLKRSKVANSNPPRVVVVRGAPVQAKYDAATLDDDNRRHWANADNLSAKTANSPDVRERLRKHARYEVANNCYARGIVNTIADIVIGFGPTLTLRSYESTPSERKALREVSRLFCEWAEEVNLWGKLWTMRVAKCQDGEAFALFRNNPRLQSPVQLDLQLIEAEQIADGPWFSGAIFDPTKVDGIETDEMGNPISYKLLRNHPGDMVTMDVDPVEVHHSQIIHWFRVDRPGQLRGIPEITPALPLFAQLRRFTLATLTAAETAADFAAILTGVEADEGDIPPVWDQIEINRGTMTTTPPDTRLEQFKAEHPTTTYEMFKREILCEVARALQMPRLIALLDASGYNYSSGRLDKQASDRSIEVERYQCELVVLKKVWNAWFEEAIRIPGFLPVEVEAGMQVTPRWLWRELGHVDRMKEAQGAAAELESGTTTLSIECGNNGLDWEEVMEQRAAELQRLKELGLDKRNAENATTNNSSSAGNASPSTTGQPATN